MTDAENTSQGFFARLKQHHIYRVVVVYAVACWVLLQLSNSLFPDFGLPGYDVRYLIVALLLGFPVVLVLAWMLIKPRDPAKYTRWQKLRWKLGSVLAFAVLVLVVISGVFTWRASEHHAQRLAAQNLTKPAALTFNPPADSIVVLPFTNLSGDPEQAYFSNGITEELTDALGQNTGLTVIAWETASTYGGSKQTPAEIGKALNVAQVLGGSIERAGDEVRISVELVSTVTGQQLWSAHYDDSLRNIFAVQDKITGAIADALNVKFANLPGAPTLSPLAHDFYLKGLAALERFTAADAQIAQQNFQQAVQLDPNYADAWAELAYSYLQMSEVSTLPLAAAMSQARAAARTALALDPRNVQALMESGRVDDNDGRVAQAKAEFELAIALDPNNARAHTWYGSVLPLKQTLAQDQEAARLNPYSALIQFSLGFDYLDLHDWPMVVQAAQKAIKLSPHDLNGVFELAYAYSQLQRGKDAVSAFGLVQPDTALDKQLVEAGRLTYRALLNPARRPDALAALDKLHHARTSPVAQYQLITLYAALGEKETVIQMLPGLCTGFPDACGDLALNPVYAPLHGDPRFEKLSKQYTTITLGSAPASAASH